MAKSFGEANEILIADIYPAREKASDVSISSSDVVKAISQDTKNSVRLVHNKQEALDIIKKEAKENDVVIVMAVGSFNRLAYELKEKI